MTTTTRSGGQILVDQLLINGAELAFGVPGESYLAVLDALFDQSSLRFIICRQEGGAAMMAEAYGKMTGRPGIAMVTRGPGATNASAGVHVAFQDSTPMILLVGQIARNTAERDAFQEIDYRQMYGPMAKWVASIDDAARIPEFIHRAYMTAMAGRPGPVVLALPEDMLTDLVSVDDGRPAIPPSPGPSAADMDAVAAHFAQAEKPLIIVGGSGWTQQACGDLARFADRHNIPVASGFRRQDLIDNEHRCYAGDLGIGANPKLMQLAHEADYWLMIGSRFGEMASGGYSRLNLPVPDVAMTHVLNGAEELGRIYQPDRVIQSTMPEFARALEALPSAGGHDRRDWCARGRDAYLGHRQAPTIPGSMQMADVMAYLGERLPRDAIITNGAGNYTAWPNRYYCFGGLRTQLAPTSGSMGYGLPAAVAAALTEPDRTVICFAGDGCLMMTVQEIATAVQYRLPIKILVINNGMFGTIRMHQERQYPSRVSGTALHNPDFAGMAQAFGAHGARVRDADAFKEAFDAAMAHEGPALIELVVDPEALTPVTTIQQTRDDARRRQD